MTGAHDGLWASIPNEALHPVRVPIIEALWWVGRPLSALALVDVLDGFLTMWEATYHLRVLDELGVAEPVSAVTKKRPKGGRLLEPYRLKGQEPGDGG